MKDVQATMQGVLDRCVAEGRERGVQLTAYLNGELIVDAWAGVADAETGRLVDGETLFPVFSVSKGITATIIHLLAERGMLSYDMPIAMVWPEFAAQGKGSITVRHVLSHTAGVPMMPQGIGYRELVDWDTMCADIAKLHPISAPGAEHCYHALTYGWLMGEVAQRVDGRPFSQLLHDEIRVPLGLTDSLFMGIPDAVEPRVAVLEEYCSPNEPVLPDDNMPQSIPGWIQPLSTMMNRSDTRRACLPAATGIFTARALARHYAALLPGGVDGVELLPPHRVRQVTQPQLPTDNPMAEPISCYSLGYQRFSDACLPVFGHGGHGGSIGFADLTYGLAVGLTKNRFSPNYAHDEIVQALRDALDLS